MGDVQRLSNGNSLIAWWGKNTAPVMEIDSKGNKIFELTLPDSEVTYRAFRFNLDKSYNSSFVPYLILPPNGSQVGLDSVILVWKKNKFSQKYHLKVALDPDFKNMYYEDSALVKAECRLYNLDTNKVFYWQVTSYNSNDTMGGYNGVSDIWSFNNVTFFDISQNYPNPVVDKSTINYKLLNQCRVKLIVYNNIGCEIATLVNEEQTDGYYSVIFASYNVPNGVYYYCLQAGNFFKVRNMVILR